MGEGAGWVVYIVLIDLFSALFVPYPVEEDVLRNLCNAWSRLYAGTWLVADALIMAVTPYPGLCNLGVGVLALR